MTFHQEWVRNELILADAVRLLLQSDVQRLQGSLTSDKRLHAELQDKYETTFDAKEITDFLLECSSDIEMKMGADRASLTRRLFMLRAIRHYVNFLKKEK